MSLYAVNYLNDFKKRETDFESDVEEGEHPGKRRLSRLTGALDDEHRREAQILTSPAQHTTIEELLHSSTIADNIALFCDIHRNATTQPAHSPTVIT